MSKASNKKDHQSNPHQKLHFSLERYYNPCYTSGHAGVDIIPIGRSVFEWLEFNLCAIILAHSHKIEQ
jgi:hypothetical protein